MNDVDKNNLDSTSFFISFQIMMLKNEIEGYGVGGKVQIVKRERPEFMRDISPYFMPSFLLILAHIIFLYTGNLMMPIWLALT